MNTPPENVSEVSFYRAFKQASWRLPKNPLIHQSKPFPFPVMKTDHDLESALCAALDTLPKCRNAAATIGQRLGVSAREAGLHSHRTRRRVFHDGRGQVAAGELVTRLPAKGETVHFLMDGNFRLSDVIPIIQQHIGQPCRLTICTLGLNNDTTDQLAAMLKAGTLAELRLAFSSYFKASDPDTAVYAVQTLTRQGATVAVERLHAKLQLYQPAKGRARYVLETSSNLRSCQCVEVVSVTNDPGLYHWHDQWLTGFFNRNSIKL